MAEQAFGGDDTDTGSPAPAKSKKPNFSKFGLSPDANIRDVFWKIMASYSAKKTADLTQYEQDRFALMNVSLSILSPPENGHYGLSSKFIATYTLMMLIDAHWDDAFSEYLIKSNEAGEKVSLDIVHGIKKLISNEYYLQIFIKEFSTMLRGKDSNETALKYVADLHNEKIIVSIKKELMIFARGDIGSNQINAIESLALLKQDDEVKKTLISLLSHWDSEARMAVVDALKAWKNDEEVKKAAKNRLLLETEEQIKKALERLGK